MENIGERIRRLRQKKELTQAELGEMIGVQKSAIAKYENGRVSTLKRDTIHKLATALDVKPSYLLGMEETEQLDRLLSYYTKLSDLNRKAKINKLVGLIKDLDNYQIELISELIEQILGTK